MRSLNATTVDNLALDLRYAVRRLLRDRGFTLAAMLILAVGIGANTAMFSLVNAVLFREQPLEDPTRLVDIYQRNSNPGALAGNSYPAYRDMAEYTDIFASTAAAVLPIGVHYRDEGPVRAAVAQFATATYLNVLGLHPSLGRWFNATEDVPGAAIVGLVGHRTWIGKFGADPSILGRTIRIDGVPVTIVGVGPAGHNATVNLGIVTDFWLPISAISALGGPPRALDRRPDEAAFFVKARLRDGVTVAQAQAAMDALGKRLASEYPTEDPGAGISVYASSEVRIHPQLDTFVGWLAAVLLAVVAFVLAIACSNLATLLLVRGAARAKEVSIRLAMGATRRQLVRHLLTESLILSAAGGAAGCLMAWWAIRSFSTFDLPIDVELSVDYRVLTFAAAISLLTGVAFGLAPALEATRIDLVPTLRDAGETRTSGHRRLTLKNALVVFQVALSVVLLGGTSIFLQMVKASRAQRVGFAIDGVAMLETDARYAGYSGARAATACEEIRQRVAALPGVQSAVLTHGMPMETTGLPIVVDRAPTAPGIVAGAIWAGPGYFDTLRIPILYGRAIDERDRRDTPHVAVINETMARQSFGTVNAVGRRFRLERDTNGWFEVVGVARDTGTADLQGDLVDPTSQLFYRSFIQSDVLPTTVVAQTTLDAATLLGAMQREMRTVNAALPVLSAKTMAQYLEDSLRGSKAVVTFLAGLGALGLCLAGIGLYALVSFAVSRRSREIGIRMALGARSQQVVWTVTGEIAVLVTIGTAAGLGLSILAALALRAAATPAPGISLYSPSADPAALLAIASFMAAVGLAAASFPAWRAATMDPLNTLRRD